MKRKSAGPSFSRRPSFNKKRKLDKAGRTRQRNQRVALLALLFLLALTGIIILVVYHDQRNKQAARTVSEAENTDSSGLQQWMEQGAPYIDVIQCIPTSEMSYATNSRNVDSISIECCHNDETGVFEQTTYDSTVKLTAWLCARFGLTSEQVIRHYDVTGKECPKYYVDHPDAWEQMKADIAAQITVDQGLMGIS